MSSRQNHQTVRKPDGRRARSSVLPEQFTLKNATLFGGANLIWRFLEYIRFVPLLASALAPYGKAKHAKYSLGQEVLLLLVGRMLGLGRIADFSEVEQDPLLTRLFGLPKLPDVTSRVAQRDAFCLVDIVPKTPSWLEHTYWENCSVRS